mgnify:FL=1
MSTRKRKLAALLEKTGLTKELGPPTTTNTTYSALPSTSILFFAATNTRSRGTVTITAGSTTTPTTSALAAHTIRITVGINTITRNSKALFPKAAFIAGINGEITTTRRIRDPPPLSKEILQRYPHHSS